MEFLAVLSWVSFYAVLWIGLFVDVNAGRQAVLIVISLVLAFFATMFAYGEEVHNGKTASK